MTQGAVVEKVTARGICATCGKRATCAFLLVKVLPYGTTVSWCAEHERESEEG